MRSTGYKPVGRTGEDACIPICVGSRLHLQLNQHRFGDGFAFGTLARFHRLVLHCEIA